MSVEALCPITYKPCYYREQVIKSRDEHIKMTREFGEKPGKISAKIMRLLVGSQTADMLAEEAEKKVARQDEVLQRCEVMATGICTASTTLGEGQPPIE